MNIHLPVFSTQLMLIIKQNLCKFDFGSRSLNKVRPLSKSDQFSDQVLCLHQAEIFFIDIVIQKQAVDVEIGRVVPEMRRVGLSSWPLGFVILKKIFGLKFKKVNSFHNTFLYVPILLSNGLAFVILLG